MLCGVRAHLVLEDVAIKKFSLYTSDKNDVFAEVTEGIFPNIYEHLTNKDVSFHFEFSISFEKDLTFEVAIIYRTYSVTQNKQPDKKSLLSHYWQALT